MTILYPGMTGFDGEGWPWAASRARFTTRKTGSKQQVQTAHLTTTLSQWLLSNLEGGGS